MKKTLLLLAVMSAAYAGEVTVEKVNVNCDAQRMCRFDVTLRHADTGWEHYANRWEILSPSGKILATRVLHHPHENEQPFTRSLSGVKIPAGMETVQVRGNDSVHGLGPSVTIKIQQ